MRPRRDVQAGFAQALGDVLRHLLREIAELNLVPGVRFEIWIQLQELPGRGPRLFFLSELAVDHGQDGMVVHPTRRVDLPGLLERLGIPALPVEVERWRRVVPAGMCWIPRDRCVDQTNTSLPLSHQREAHAEFGQDLCIIGAQSHCPRTGRQGLLDLAPERMHEQQ